MVSDRQTHVQNKYYNPHCACGHRVDELFLIIDWYTHVELLRLGITNLTATEPSMQTVNLWQSSSVSYIITIIVDSLTLAKRTLSSCHCTLLMLCHGFIVCGGAMCVLVRVGWDHNNPVLKVDSGSCCQ